MEYKRIQKPHLQQQKQLSPAKLRAMILGGGVEKKRRQGGVGGGGEEAEELSTGFSLRSHDAEIHDSGFYKSGATSSEECKDVDVVSVLTNSSISAPMDSHDCKMKDFSGLNSGARPLDDSSLDYDIGIESTSMSPMAFEFQKGERFPQRVPPLTPFSKPAPSKWDDAQKWIASPTSNRSKNGLGNQGTGARKTSLFGHGGRQQSTKVINENPDEGLFPDEEADTKWIDSSHAKKDNVLQKSVSFDAYQSVAESHDQQIHVIDQCAVESAINLSRHDSLLSIHGSTTIIPPVSMARSVSMRDMGTEMTPIASQEPSRAGTPVRATTPTRSPASSRPETPRRAASTMPVDINNNDLSEKELHMKTRREIMALGTQLGKASIAAWASKAEEYKEGSSTIRNLADDKQPDSVIQTRAAAWEEAENAKYIARFKREEIKIQAWENHQIAKTEAEMRKVEVDVERMRSKAHDKLMNKLASVQQKAEEKRAVAEAQRNRRAAKTEQQAEHIRKTGRIPSSSFFCCKCRWCFWK